MLNSSHSSFVYLVSQLMAPTLQASSVQEADDPDEDRKVHVTPIPRVGGWGIIVGALIPVLTLADLDKTALCYLFGCLVLLLFGALDDIREMGHYTKFIGQIIAVIPMIFMGGLHVTEFPFISYEFPTWFLQAFTMVAMIGVINAINHSDGLDGLAGGETLISLGAIALIAYLTPGDNLTIAFWQCCLLNSQTPGSAKPWYCFSSACR